MSEGMISVDGAVDVRKLLYFALIVQWGSMGKAAKALQMSQPALSLSMEGLEAELGTKLLIRSSTGVEPTETGEALIRHARQVLECLSAVEEEFLKGGGPGRGVLHFGCLPTLAGSIVPQAIRRWQSNFPELSLQVTERPQNELLWGLLRRDFDFSIGVIDVDNHVYGLRQRVLFRERLYVVSRPQHPLANQTVISLGDLIHYPWVTPTTGWRNTALEHILEPAGLILQQKVTVCSSISLLKSLVAGSDHLALLPAHAVEDERVAGKLCLLPFYQNDLERNIAVFLREGSSVDEAGNALLQLIQEQGRQRYLKESPSAIDTDGEMTAV